MIVTSRTLSYYFAVIVIITSLPVMNTLKIPQKAMAQTSHPEAVKVLVDDVIQSLKSNELVNEWANKVKIDDFSKSIFLSASYGIGQAGKCVYVTTPEIDTNDPDLLYFDPIMETSRLVKQAFVDHINRSARSKNKEKQFEEGKPVIIAIKAKEWRLNFEEEHKKILEIKETIQNELKQYSDISGVIIFSSDLYLCNGRYIENIVANPDIRIAECDLQSLGIMKIYRTTES